MLDMMIVTNNFHLKSDEFFRELVLYNFQTIFVLFLFLLWGQTLFRFIDFKLRIYETKSFTWFDDKHIRSLRTVIILFIFIIIIIFHKHK